MQAYKIYYNYLSECTNRVILFELDFYEKKCFIKKIPTVGLILIPPVYSSQYCCLI